MNTKDFADKVENLRKDICNNDGVVYSHAMQSRVIVRCVDTDDDSNYELESVGFESLVGCECPCDIVLNIKKVK